jgi:hypothetical protein
MLYKALLFLYSMLNIQRNTGDTMYYLEIQIDRVYARTSNAVLATMYWSSGVAGSLDEAVDALTEKYGEPDFIQHGV